MSAETKVSSYLCLELMPLTDIDYCTVVPVGTGLVVGLLSIQYLR